MKKTLALLLIGFACLQITHAADFCKNSGPQTPRDISNKTGTNPVTFPAAPPASELNLCNIHFHKNAEHKGPYFSKFAGSGEHGGYQCTLHNYAPNSEWLIDPAKGQGACHGVKPGDTIEVHWVHTSCDATPGPGLGSCLPTTCKNPILRVEAAVFRVANTTHSNGNHMPTADFSRYAYAGNKVNGLHQAKSLPNIGKPVVFPGSTTGPSYTQKVCSPAKVTWGVRPGCATIDIVSLNKWCENNVFKENHAHGVRQLVTEPSLLAPIQ